MVEESPGIHALRGLDPDVGSVFAAIDGEACSTEFATNDRGVIHVEAHQGLHFGLTGFGVNSLSSALNDVAHTVELGALTSVPQPPEFHRFAVGRFAFQPFGHHGEGTAGAGEASVFGEGTEFDGTVPGSFDLEDGVGEFRVLDEGLIGSIEEDQCAIGAGVVHPGLELFPGGDGTGGVVGEAEVDQVDRFTGNLRCKAVVCADR